MNKKTRAIATAILTITSMLLLEYAGYIRYTEYKATWLPVYMSVLPILIVLIILMPHTDRYDYLNYLSISVLAIWIVLAIILMTHIDKYDYLSMGLFATASILVILTVMTIRSKKRPKK